jgi:hypothetical protein
VAVDTENWTKSRHALKAGGTFVIANSKTENVGEIQSNTTSGGGAYPTAAHCAATRNIR